jgi:hypothetical protein
VIPAQPAGPVGRLKFVRWMWALLLVVAGCSSGPDDPFPAGPSDLVLRVVDTGGLLGPGWEYQLPAISLYGDGLLVLAGRPVTHRRLTVNGVRRVVRAAVNAGLAKEQDYGTPPIVDASVSIYTLVAEKRFENKVIAPSESNGDTAAQSEARQRVRAFRKGLNDLDSWLGDDIGAPASPGPGPHLVHSYRTTAHGTAIHWPFGDLPDAGCRLLPAAQAAALPQARPGQLWREGDDYFVLVIRPLLPDEKGCADIK